MMEDRESLRRHITPKVDEARLTRQRDAISARLQGRKRARWPLLLVPCVIVILLLAFRSRTEPPLGLPATIVEAPSSEPLPMTLLDGSRVVLAPGTRLSLMTLLPKDIRLEMSHGELDLDVTHVEGRSFVVVAAGYEVRVVGTHFAVKRPLDGERATLEVRVQRGRVRVTRIGEPAAVRELAAGETWSTVLDTAASPAASNDVPSAVPDAASTATAEAAPDASAAENAPPALPVRPSAKELWSQAEAARSAKRFQDEARALDALRLRYRSDSRAGLAAFELGRLRQDTLHDPAGAAEAFADAVALAPNGPFREDAEARRVEALDATGNRAKCMEAKSAFLNRYSAGIHRPRVSRMCESR